MSHSDLMDVFGMYTPTELCIDKLCPSMQQYVKTCMQYTDAKPGFLLTAWLPFVAVNISNKAYMYNNSSKIYANIWSCIIGPSSVSRKSTSLTYASYTIKPHEAEMLNKPVKEYEQGTLVLNGTTLSKLMTYLSMNPGRVFVHHEISSWLNEMNKPYNAGYRQIITELFDGVNRTISNRDRTEKIVEPSLSIASATTEGWLFRYLTDSVDQMSGFMQRMLFYVVKNVDLNSLKLDNIDGRDLAVKLATYDQQMFTYWRQLPQHIVLKMNAEAEAWKNVHYMNKFKETYMLGNENVMSYFARMYDNYFYKFCILIWLMELTRADWEFLMANTLNLQVWHEFLDAMPVSLNIVQQAWYLCDFYMSNTIPLITIMEERDKLVYEKRVVNLLINSFNGVAEHSALLNRSHLKKREFHEAIESLIERNAIWVEAGPRSANHLAPKIYKVNKALYENWKQGVKNFSTLAQPIHFDQTKSVSFDKTG